MSSTSYAVSGHSLDFVPCYVDLVLTDLWP